MTQGTQYLLEIFFPAGDDAYYFGIAPTVGQHITYYDMRYCNGCTQNTFQTSSLGGMLYGYVDMWYWIKNNVSPAPAFSSWLLYHLYDENETYVPFIDSCLRIELFENRLIPEAYAFWYDRQLTFVQGKPQKYGEYMIGFPTKLAEIEKVDSVDFFRQQIGLPPLWQSARVKGFSLPEGYKKPD